jgi:hypothetical protein
MYVVGISACFIGSLVFFLHQLFMHQPIHFPFYRGYAYEKLIARIMEEYYPKYEKIVITKGKGSPYIYLLFFSSYDPVRYQKFGSPRDLDYQGFDTFLFVPQDCPMENTMFEEEKKTGKVVFVHTDTCKSTVNTKVLETIPWKEGSPAFQIVVWQASVSGQLL